MSEPDDCPFHHENIETLYGVPPMPIEDLPKVCTCGHPLTYHPDGVVFVSFPSQHDLYATSEVMVSTPLPIGGKS